MSKQSCFLNSSRFNSSQHMPWLFCRASETYKIPKDRLLLYGTPIDETQQGQDPDIAKCQDSHFGTTSAPVRVVLDP